ncbi:MAG: hypothetical protein A3D10_06430 [Omnitrophica WOR_2 bacterium RIFCSPHIGHO2_02_FULL_48_11]|nr:MAG: hypothetical protein A3D10_06430 [Omnitrophica WOR_2 bacterium RIFCSPHIGHO2_02_FULL_48_11]
MKSANKLYQYLSDGVSFVSHKATGIRTLYAPLCGIDAHGLKSSISPFLSGDIKIDQHHYLTKPVSTEDLRSPARNFFVYVEGKGVFSLAESAPGEESFVEVGQLWHKLVRRHKSIGLQMQAINFIPVTGETVELMRVTLKNTGKKKLKITPTAFVPIFGRAQANKHDHEQVTSLLQRIQQLPEGVLVAPTMLFNEEGHVAHASAYYVFGTTGKGKNPVGIFPTIENFCGDAGHWLAPQAVTENLKPAKLSAQWLDGKEAAGALRFADEILKPGDAREYFIALGIAKEKSSAEKIFRSFNAAEKFEQALAKNENFWSAKTHSIEFYTGDDQFNSWMQWVTLQPILRRIFGNSFLPDHDYGKGGKGWRDLWQDLLSLILIEPENVRESLINNFAGIRIDGSNATIIGALPGEFIADRNMITRVWMDHGAWPLLTVLLYVNQTGDYAILLKEATYFRDMQQSRAVEKDLTWHPAYGDKLKSKAGHIYQGTILEHLLVQNLVQFFNVGEHNMIRLENADWNDGLDMAAHRGESVAFMSFYGGNLLEIADLLEEFFKKNGAPTVRLAKELKILFSTLADEPCDYDSPEDKKKILYQDYFSSVQPELSGEQIEFKISDLVHDLRSKGQWIFQQIRKQEKVTVEEKGKAYTWFNGYYDNKGLAVEGKKNNRIWMTLTGQVFAVMSGLASPEECDAVVASVRRYLQDKKTGGYRLNTDFGRSHYLDLGRAFGFAYGTKENGAFFSHMIVMYAYALYSRGLVREGRDVLRSIFNMCLDTDKSKIYPGVPEYFDSNGRGMYHYLTGSASWFVLTELTQVFGVRGEGGDLILSPKLVKEEFDKKGQAAITCHFAGKKITVTYLNPAKVDYGNYAIQDVSLNGRPVKFEKISSQTVKIPRKFIEPGSGDLNLRMTL